MAPSRKQPLKVRVLRLPHGSGLDLPAQQTGGAAGLDLLAALDPDTPVRLAPGARALIPTGLMLELPAGYEGQIRPRSGLAFKSGVTVLNSPGTIDSDYRGEVKILLVNLGEKPFKIERGDRIAQLVVASVTPVRLVAARSVSTTERGAGGFGSTSEKKKAKKTIPNKRVRAKSSTKKTPKLRARRQKPSRSS
jgi:dUTP diphosphatase